MPKKKEQEQTPPAEYCNCNDVRSWHVSKEWVRTADGGSKIETGRRIHSRCGKEYRGSFINGVAA